MDKLYGLIQDINPKEICNHIENGNLVEWCNAWRIAAKEALQQKTNADRIRAMSDEELAKWLARTQYANMMEAAEIFGAQLPFEEETLNGSEQECLQWLKQPAEE